VPQKWRSEKKKKGNSKERSKTAEKKRRGQRRKLDRWMKAGTKTNRSEVAKRRKAHIGKDQGGRLYSPGRGKEVDVKGSFFSNYKKIGFGGGGYDGESLVIGDYCN